MTLDEFLALKMNPQAKLVALYLATREQRVVTHAEAAAALHIHQAEVEQAALALLRPDETPLHPIAVGQPAAFEMPADHALRAAVHDFVAVGAKKEKKHAAAPAVARAHGNKEVE